MADTVSLDVAKKLKAAGCVWEPKAEDKYIGGDYTAIVLEGPHTLENGKSLMLIYDYANAKTKTVEFSNFSIGTWLPALSPVLSRLKELGYCWELSSCRSISIWLNYEKAKSLKYPPRNACFGFEAATSEDSAGLALIWALGQEGGRA